MFETRRYDLVGIQNLHDQSRVARYSKVYGVASLVLDSTSLRRVLSTMVHRSGSYL